MTSLIAKGNYKSTKQNHELQVWGNKISKHQIVKQLLKVKPKFTSMNIKHFQFKAKAI